jgi:hypothetical protein
MMIISSIIMRKTKQTPDQTPPAEQGIEEGALPSCWHPWRRRSQQAVAGPPFRLRIRKQVTRGLEGHTGRFILCKRYCMTDSLVV